MSESENKNVAVQGQQQLLKCPNKIQSYCEVKKNLVIGEKLWEGKGKSGAGFIKSVGMEGVTMIYTWTAQMKGMGKAKGVDCNLNMTGKSMTPTEGDLFRLKIQGMMMSMTGDMGVVKGVSLMKMAMGKDTDKRGLIDLMTMSEKLGWLE